MDKKVKSPRILSKLSSKSSSSKSSTLSKDFKNKNNQDDKSTNSVSKVSLSFKELKKQQDKQLKLQQQQFKLQQKQLKIQQKKIEKEQKQNTLKSNKSKSNEPIASTSNPAIISAIVDDEKRFNDGIKFKGKLVGIEPVMSARGDKMCQNALKNLRLRRTSSHKQRIILNINLNGVQLLDLKSNELVANHVINLISYITRDISDNKVFGYVYGTQELGHQFIAIKSEKDSMYVMNAIGELFTYVYNKKKKEKQEHENRQSQFEQSTTDNSQSSHTLIDNKQPQTLNQGFDNEALMNFLKQQDKLHNQASTSSTLPTVTQDDFNSTEFSNEKENSFINQPSNKFNTLPTTLSSSNTLPPPLLPPRNESAQSNYSSSSNLNSFNTYSHSNFDTSASFRNSGNNYQSNLSIATTHDDSQPCNEMQQMQNVISSARKANDKFKGWQCFEDGANDEFGSNSLISEKDDENDSADDNWANFSEPPDHPPPLYQSNEDLSMIASADTYTLTNQTQFDNQFKDQAIEKFKDSFNDQFNDQFKDQFNDQFNDQFKDHSKDHSKDQFNNQTINKQPISLNNSQNSTSTAFAVHLDPPSNNRPRRRSARLSESSNFTPDNNNLNTSNNKDNSSLHGLDETKRRPSIPITTQPTSNRFESDFSQPNSNEFFDFDRLNNNSNNNRFNEVDKTSTLKRNESLSRESRESNHSFDLNREESISRNESRNESRSSNYNSNQFNSFDSQFDNQANQLNNRRFGDNFQSMQTINTMFNNDNFATPFSNATTANKSTDNAQSNNRQLLDDSLSNKRLSLNDLNRIDPNDKYAVFNDINSMKFSIFANDGSIIEQNEDDQVFLTNNQSNDNKNQLTNTNSNNKSQNFEDSFLSGANSSLNQSKNSSLYSTTTAAINKPETQLNQSKLTKQDSVSSSIYSSTTADPELLECHKKFLQERQEKLDQIDSIFEEEKQKLRAKQKELNQQHLKQQKNLLNQQKTYQQEFYQHQKHKRQTILHQLQIQRLPVQQFDQCKLQLQLKLKEDQKRLQTEFIKKQQELKKQQVDEQNQLLKQYKVLEEQYLEKQSELLNSDFEIEIDLPDLPNIFDDAQLDDGLSNEQAITKKFELSLKNEFDKLTNEIIQTTSTISSLNSSPKLVERCPTSCSIASSSNPFVGDEKERFTFEDFDKALNLTDNKIDWRGSQNSSITSGTISNRQFDLDFYMFNDSKDNSLEYGSVNKPINERISSVSSLETNRSTLTLPVNLNSNANNPMNLNLNKSLNTETFGNKMNTGIELKPSFNHLNQFRSQQQLSNSLPKSLENSYNNQTFSQSMINSFSSNFSSNFAANTQNNQEQKSTLKQPFLPQHHQQVDSNQFKSDPFNCSFVDTKLNEINRIKELRQHTQKQLVSLTLPEESVQLASQNQSTNALSSTNSSLNNSINQQHYRPVQNQFVQPNQVKIPDADKRPTTGTSIQELEDLLGLPTSTLNRKKENNQTTDLNRSFNSSFNATSSANQTSSSNANSLNNNLFDNLFDLKKNNSLANFSNSEFNQSKPQTNLFANDNFKKNLSFQDLRSDSKTDQFLNSLDVFGTVVVADLNNKSSAKKLSSHFSHFGTDPITQEPSIFNMYKNTKEDPFKDDFFNS